MATAKTAEKPQSLAEKRIAVLGAGKIATILVQAMLQKGLLSRDLIHGTVQHEEKARAIQKETGIQTGTDNLAAVKGADIVFVCVKPQVVGQVLEQISPVLTSDQLLISVAASVPIDAMQKRVAQPVPILRTMPNTPSFVGSGMTAIARGKYANQSHVDIALSLFNTVGRTVEVDEKHMDAITGLSASGPAFIYIILESLAEAGVKVGLPRDLATLLAAQTTMGAAKMVLDTGAHPALLKDAVTTPAGCTIDGILELEEGKLRVTLIKAVVKAAQRASELVYS